MDIKTVIEDGRAHVSTEGKLTVQTSPDLEAAIDAIDSSVANIDIDLANVTYISSAGLRVLVATSKLAMRRGGVMRLLNPCDEVMDVFEMTGLADIFEIVR